MLKKCTICFRVARQFNGDIYSWDTTNVENMQQMLYNCDLFDQSLAAWTIANVSNFTNFMQNATGLSTSNYDATLIAWAAGVQILV